MAADAAIWFFIAVVGLHLLAAYLTVSFLVSWINDPPR